MDHRNLVSTTSLVVDYFDAGKDRLAFTFSSYIPANTAPVLTGPGFGGEFLLKEGFDVVAFKPTFNSWYQDAPVHLAAIRSTLRNYGLKVGYGVSMGAYGAMLCSQSLEMDRVFAISPLYVIGGGWDKRWATDIKGQSLTPTLNPACTYFMAFDPLHQDARHIERYEALAPIVKIPIPGAAHRIPYVFSKSGNLKGLAASILAKGLVPSELLPAATPGVANVTR